MSNPIIPKIVCQRCRASLDADDNYCRRCGAPTVNAQSESRWWESPWVIVPMLLLVIGPLALPMLWRSRQFSQLWKIILTVLVTILTAWLCWRLWVAMQQTAAALDRIEQQL
jgi:hypothetical protein